MLGPVMDVADGQLQREAERRMAGYLSRIATGPTLSKDLDRAEARDGMEMVLRGEVDRAQAAVFLIALRMKRETHEELCGVLDALRASAAVAEAPVDDLVDMAEPYNGYVRHLPAAPFVPAVLAACEVPCVLHGCREAGPKRGVTAHQILAAAGVDVTISSERAASLVGSAGWAYVDLQAACAPLDALARLRDLIVKRPCLSLLEKLIAPIRPHAGGRLHLWVGYTHREYPEILEALARDAVYASMLAVRGVEGGVTTTLSGQARGFRFADTEEMAEVSIAARAGLGRAADERAPALPDVSNETADTASASARLAERDEPAERTARNIRWAQLAADAGLAALDGATSPTADMLALSAAAVLRHLGRVNDLASGVAQARAVLAGGHARARLEALTG